jgi:AraC family transcriptional activator of pobA
MTPIQAVPTFNLYGELEHWPTPDMLHCETISARSKLHNWHIKPHRHNGLFQILFLKSGSALVQLDDRQHKLAQDQILMVPQMCIHGFEFSAHAEGHVLTLAYPLLNKMVGQMDDRFPGLHGPSMHTLGKDEDSRHIKTIFGTLDREYRKHAPYRNLLIESLLAAILVWVARHSLHSALEQPKAIARGDRHFTKFCSLMEEGYLRHYPVAHYANEIGITSAHLNVLCRQTVDKSALEMIHERLMLEARRNLVYTSMTISQVSYAIGFSDPAYFTRFFKREAGVSPKEFRGLTET